MPNAAPNAPPIDKPLTLTQLAVAILPEWPDHEDGRRPLIVSVRAPLRRWAKRGIGGVRLRVWQVGRVWVTTLEHYREFQAAREAAQDGPTPSAKPPVAPRNVAYWRRRANQALNRTEA